MSQIVFILYFSHTVVNVLGEIKKQKHPQNWKSSKLKKQDNTLYEDNIY